MAKDTTASGGPNSAAAGGPSADGQSGPGASQRVTGTASGSTAGQPDGGTASNLTTGGDSPQNVGLAQVFQGGPGAGKERVTGAGSDQRAPGTTGQPDPAGQPKGNPRPNQSNDTTLPEWTQQLPKKMIGDPNSMGRLQGFKTLDDFVQAYLDAESAGPNLPGKDSTPEDVQAFYERLGKPKDAASYKFAKTDPVFAKTAFAANLTTSQAEALYGASLAQMDDVRKGIQASVANDFIATDKILQKEYGEKFPEAIVFMQRGLGNDPKTGALSQVANDLLNAGLAGKPEIVKAFIELGRATSEGAGASGNTRGPQPKSVMEGARFDYKDSYS